MTITADEMREMAADLDSIDCGYSAILDDAAAMLRSIAEEMEASSEKLHPASQLLHRAMVKSGRIKE